MIRVIVQAGDFDVSQEMELMRRAGTGVGAIVSFVGLVRDDNAIDPLVSMTLEHYPGMTERELGRIAAEAHARWKLQAVTVIHRHGELRPGAQIVLVLTASSHRGDAFDAAAFLMDYLKVQAPFWKKETRHSGEAWVEARHSDDASAERWNNKSPSRE
jgi:molybdopterin synthase catalytic subunit